MLLTTTVQNSAEGKIEGKMVNVNLIITLLTNTDSPWTKTIINMTTGGYTTNASL